MSSNSITSGLFAPEFHSVPTPQGQRVEISPPPQPALLQAIHAFMHEHQAVQIIEALADGEMALDPPSRIGSPGKDDALLSAVRREAQAFFANHPTLDQHSLLITRDKDCLLHISYAPEIRHAVEKMPRKPQRKERAWWERGEGV